MILSSMFLRVNDFPYLFILLYELVMENSSVQASKTEDDLRLLIRPLSLDFRGHRC